MSMLSYLSAVRQITIKELKGEWRTKTTLHTALIFIVLTVTLLKFVMGVAEPEPELLIAGFWLTLFFTGMINYLRPFVKEVEQLTADLLKLATRPSQVFVSKFISNLIQGLIAAGLLSMIFFFFFDSGWVISNPFLLLTIAATLAISSISTFVGAIVAQAGNKGTLFPVLVLPILLPLAMILSKAGQAILSGIAFENYISMLVIFFGITFMAGLIIFDYIWE